MVGCNDYGEFGIGTTGTLKQLTPFPVKAMTKVYRGSAFTIYADEQHADVLVAGNNIFRQCCNGSDDEKITEYEPITFFKRNGINIKKICVNAGGHCAFFISDTDRLYGGGRNDGGQLGLQNTTKHMNEPVLIDELEDVLDAQSSKTYAVALCGFTAMATQAIIQNWSRIHAVPRDITLLVIMFSKSTKVCSTTNNIGSGHSEDSVGSGWNEIECFNERTIIRICVGRGFSLFLEETGSLWVCGENEDGKLGLGDEATFVWTPTEIVYFKENGIKIVDVKCGYAHTLALSDDGRVFSWGLNEYGQLGDASATNCSTPQYVDFFDGLFVIDGIECGYSHSFCRTECGEHFSFGSNYDGECLVRDDEDGVAVEEVLVPHCIEEEIQEQYDMKSVMSVHPGWYNTSVICKI